MTRLGKNASFTLIAALGAAALGLANSLLIGRLLGSDGRGEVAFLTSVAGTIGFLATLSTHEWITNTVAHDTRRTPAAYGLALRLAAAGGAVGMVAAAIAFWQVPMLADPRLAPGVVAAVASVPLAVANVHFAGMLRGLSQHTYANAVLLATALAAIIATVACAAAGVLNSSVAVMAWVGGQLVASGIAAGRLHALGYRPTHPEPGAMRAAVTFGAKAHLAGTMNTVSYKCDQWILGANAGASALGVYAVAAAYFEALFLVPGAIALVLRPRIVAARHEDVARTALYGLAAALAVTTCAAGVLWVAAPVLCEVIFGPEFTESTALLRILTAGSFGICAVKILSMTLVARGAPLAESAATGIGFIAALIAYFTLIPAFGATGAAWGSVIAYSLAGLACIAVTWQLHPLRPRSERSTTHAT